MLFYHLQKLFATCKLLALYCLWTQIYCFINAETKKWNITLGAQCYTRLDTRINKMQTSFSSLYCLFLDNSSYQTSLESFVIDIFNGFLWFIYSVILFIPYTIEWKNNVSQPKISSIPRESTFKSLFAWETITKSYNPENGGFCLTLPLIFFFRLERSPTRMDCCDVIPRHLVLPEL